MGNFNRNDNSGGRGDYGNRSYGGGDREMFKATCANCGKECEVPFRPTGSRPVYCSDCFKKNSSQEGGGDRNDTRDRRRGLNDRQMFNAVCDNCGDKCQLPFMPREGKEVLCSKCFEEKGGNARKSGGVNPLEIAAINEKLDKIIELLSPTSSTPKKEKKAKAAKEVTTEEVAVVEEITPEIESFPETDVVQATPEIAIVNEEIVNEEVVDEETPKVTKKNSKKA